MTAVITCVRLTKSYGGKRALDGLSLEVPKGAIFALLGDNGAGKSTTIRILTGLIPADSGTAIVLDHDAYTAAYRLRHKVGYVPERPKYYDWMTVDEIGRFAAAFHHAGYRARYREQAERFGLSVGDRLSALSKGGYAKVGLALALANDPEVLILDEPTSGLDLFTRREFLTSMVELAGDGRTILISSHAIAELERVASHVAFLSEGKLLLSGPLDELRKRMVRVRIQHDGREIATEVLGNVLDVEARGREWAACVLDLATEKLDEVRALPGVQSVEAGPLTLEEMYTSLLARGRRRPAKEKEAVA
jgi:ABC-2 type transport system ATP-binding protein